MEQVLMWCKDKEYLKRLVSSINSKAAGAFIALALSDTDDIKKLAMRDSVRLALIEEGYEDVVDIRRYEEENDVKENEEEINIKDIEGLECYSICANAVSPDVIGLYSKAGSFVDFILNKLGVEKRSVDGKKRGRFGVISFVGLEDIVDTFKGSYVNDRIADSSKELNVDSKMLIWNYTQYKECESSSEVSVETILYSVKMRDDELNDKIKRAVVHYLDVDVLDAPHSFTDLRELDCEDIIYMLNILDDMYDIIAVNLDIGCLKNSDSLGAIGKVIVLDNGISKAKLAAIVDMLNRNNVAYEIR